MGGGGHYLALVARRTKPAALAREGQEVFGGAGVAADPGEAPSESSAVEEFTEDFSDDGPEGAKVRLELFGIRFNERDVVSLGTLPKGRLPGGPRAIRLQRAGPAARREQFIEPVRKTSVVVQLRNFPCGNHSTPPPFNQGLLNNVEEGEFRRCEIGDGSKRASHVESLPGFDVLYIET